MHQAENDWLLHSEDKQENADDVMFTRLLYERLYVKIEFELVYLPEISRWTFASELELMLSELRCQISPTRYQTFTKREIAQKMTDLAFPPEKLTPYVSFATQVITTVKADHQFSLSSRIKALKQPQNITSEIIARGEIEHFAHIAVSVNDLHIIRMLFAHDAALAQLTMPCGQTLLHIAVNNGYIEMVRLLLEHPINIDAQCRNAGMTPVGIAAQNGDTAMIAILAEAGANLSILDHSGESPLDIAKRLNKQSAIEELCRYIDSHDTRLST